MSPQPEGAGRVTVRVEVRYAETDQMGVAYHTNYLIWFEVGRTAYLRARGLSYRAMEEKGVFLPVAESYCRLVAPARYEDTVEIITWVEEVRSRRITFGYEAHRQGTPLATGRTVHICTDGGGRSMMIPSWVREGLGAEARALTEGGPDARDGSQAE